MHRLPPRFDWPLLRHQPGRGVINKAPIKILSVTLPFRPSSAVPHSPSPWRTLTHFHYTLARPAPSRPSPLKVLTLILYANTFIPLRRLTLTHRRPSARAAPSPAACRPSTVTKEIIKKSVKC
ncbi:hypothetical protein E2C01_097660 [Portunus trituberculatus]|uniref:Uncharacterized protein n=1 Tax=Portunus trituberculatus TaxID=210409 RepID=A0A5B7JVS0_PORTR|nr:hypothetical protein [Portunus trituberculatus]